jgi:hypothetical protein
VCEVVLDEQHGIIGMSRSCTCKQSSTYNVRPEGNYALLLALYDKRRQRYDRITGTKRPDRISSQCNTMATK